MGNSMGSAVKCQIVLEHEQEGNPKLAVVAGNELRGKVLIWVGKELRPASMTLSLHGKEKSEVRNEQRTFDSAERTLISSTVTLRESNEEPVKAGQYTLPFSIPLSSSLPTSMKAAEHSSNCKIRYKLTVLVGKDVLLKRLFTVASAALPNQVVQVTAEPKAHAIKGIRKKKGHLLMGAKVVNAHVGRSKNVEVFLACRNDASVDIERVQMRLLEKVRWSAQTYKKYGPKEDILWKNDTRVLAENTDVEVPGLKKKKKTILSEDQSEAIYQIYDDLMSGENMISLEVPYASRDTYNGQLIETSHLIEITLFTKALVESPTIEIPIQIGFPSRARGLPPQAPVPAEDRHEVFATATATATIPSTELHDWGISISSLPDAETPVAEALFFAEEEGETAQSSMVVAPPEAMVLGGSAILLVQDSETLLRDTESTESTTASPSLARLLEEMMASVDDYDIITDKLQDPEWSSLLAAITPDEFGTILAHVNVDFDQPEVASLLAHSLNNRGGNFTCDYCVAAIHNSAECSRLTTVQQLLPLCTNIQTCHAQITSELTEWENVILTQDFEDLLEGTDASLGSNSEGP